MLVTLMGQKVSKTLIVSQKWSFSHPDNNNFNSFHTVTKQAIHAVFATFTKRTHSENKHWYQTYSPQKNFTDLLVH